MCPAAGGLARREARRGPRRRTRVPSGDAAPPPSPPAPSSPASPFPPRSSLPLPPPCPASHLRRWCPAVGPISVAVDAARRSLAAPRSGRARWDRSSAVSDAAAEPSPAAPGSPSPPTRPADACTWHPHRRRGRRTPVPGTLARGAGVNARYSTRTRTTWHPRAGSRRSWISLPPAGPPHDHHPSGGFRPPAAGHAPAASPTRSLRRHRVFRGAAARARDHPRSPAVAGTWDPWPRAGSGPRIHIIPLPPLLRCLKRHPAYASLWPPRSLLRLRQALYTYAPERVTHPPTGPRSKLASTGSDAAVQCTRWAHILHRKSFPGCGVGRWRARLACRTATIHTSYRGSAGRHSANHESCRQRCRRPNARPRPLARGTMCRRSGRSGPFW